MFRIYVGNLNFRTTDEILRAAFEAHGEVQEVYIGTDRETGRSRGFGFVTMTDKTAGEAAIAAINGSQVDGRAIVVNEAQPRPPRTERGGGGGALVGKAGLGDQCRDLLACAARQWDYRKA